MMREKQNSIFLFSAFKANVNVVNLSVSGGALCPDMGSSQQKHSHNSRIADITTEDLI